MVAERFRAKYDGQGSIRIGSSRGRRASRGICSGCIFSKETHVSRHDGTKIGYRCTEIQPEEGAATLTFRGNVSQAASRDTATLTGCGVDVYKTITNKTSTSSGVFTQAKAKS